MMTLAQEAKKLLIMGCSDNSNPSTERDNVPISVQNQL